MQVPSSSGLMECIEEAEYPSESGIAVLMIRLQLTALGISVTMGSGKKFTVGGSTPGDCGRMH